VKRSIEALDNGEARLQGKRARAYVEKLKWETITGDFERTLTNLINRHTEA